MTQPELDFAAPRRTVFCRVPPEGTQCHTILLAMQRGERLTIWNAMVRYGVGALHQRILDLRGMGWAIKREEVQKNGKRVAEFWISE